MSKRALTVKQIRAYKPKTLEFTGEWLASLGKPELTGTWIIWGNSANGKTRYALKLAKYLAGFGKVLYNSLEEGLSKSMQQAIADVGMSDVQRSFLLLDKESIGDLAERLKRQRSPNVIFIDSLQYTGLRYDDYKQLRDEFPKKLFIFISHASGREPRGEVAQSVRYDAFIKVWVEGFKAYAESRYGGGSEFVIWERGAQRLE